MGEYIGNMVTDWKLSVDHYLKASEIYLSMYTRNKNITINGKSLTPDMFDRDGNYISSMVRKKW